MKRSSIGGSSINFFGLSLFSFLLLMGCSAQAASESELILINDPLTEEIVNTSTPAEIGLPPEHIIAVREQDGQGEFYNQLTGETFVVRGVNYVYVPHQGSASNLTLKVGVYDPDRTRQDFNLLASEGYNTVRVFLDHCAAGEGCIGDQNSPGLNPRYLENIADLLAAAEEAGIYVLYTSNDLPDEGGYAEQANQGSGPVFAGYRNSYYLTEGAVQATRRYWRDQLLGLRVLDAPTDRVLGWQLLNEQWMFLDQPPLSLTSGIAETAAGSYDMAVPEQKRLMVSEGLIHYIREVKAEILEHDPSTLVTMGFFAPEIVAPDWYVETSSLLAGSDLDFFDFHAYSGNQSLAELAGAFGMLDYHRKPILLGEYGSFRHLYPELPPAARAITNWQSQSCEMGFDGWIYWTYYPAAPEINDRTWGFTDESGYLLNLLSPNQHPDPCEEIVIAGENLAYQKPVRVSNSLPDQGPTLAVDESRGTQWGSGQHAPQWIEIDLEGQFAITEIRLIVAQWPEGATIHQISGRRSDGSFQVLHRFDQTTAEGDLLRFVPLEPIPNIQILRIETLSSPSWIAWGEIEVYGESIP